MRQLALIIALTITSGCRAMHTHDHGDGDVISESHLKFSDHSFSAYCYDTIGCKVLYGNSYSIRKADGVVSPPPTDPNFLESLEANRIGIDNFPSPAKVTLLSKDGAAHEANVDIGEIFRDRRARFVAPLSDIPAGAIVDSPQIILVVYDREISVYMRAFVPLKEARVKARPHSNFRSDLILAYTKLFD
jgi:hypothetical protein